MFTYDTSGVDVRARCLLFSSGTGKSLREFGKRSTTEGLTMNENAKRNLQRRKRQATRLSKREYFSKKKEAAGAAAAGKDNLAKPPLESK